MCGGFFEICARNQRLTFAVYSGPPLWKSCGEPNSMRINMTRRWDGFSSPSLDVCLFRTQGFLVSQSIFQSLEIQTLQSYSAGRNPGVFVAIYMNCLYRILVVGFCIIAFKISTFYQPLANQSGILVYPVSSLPKNTWPVYPIRHTILLHFHLPG